MAENKEKYSPMLWNLICEILDKGHDVDIRRDKDGNVKVLEVVRKTKLVIQRKDENDGK